MQSKSSDDLVDTATKDMVVGIVNCYLLPVVFIFGALGNIMSFVVLAADGSRTSTNILLLGVTVSDFGYLVSMYCRKVSCIIAKFDYFASTRVETGLIPNVYMINRVFGMTTPFLTMLITLERCLAVTFPLTIQNIVTPPRMAKVVVGVFVFAIALQLPFFFIYIISWKVDKATGQSVAVLAGTPFYYKNFEVITTYNNIVLTGIFNYGPTLLVVTCTVIVILIIKRSTRWRKASAKGSDRKEDGRTTGMLMTVVAVYIGCYLPSCAALIANSIVPDFGSLGGRYSNLFYLVSALQLLLFACNSSVNFVIYMLMSKKFFKTYCRIFLCWRDTTAAGTKMRGDRYNTSLTVTGNTSFVKSE